MGFLSSVITIITDLDGTLSQSSWRDNLLGNWDEWHAASKDDKPNLPMVRLINEFAEAGCHIVCITARPERWRGLTNKWLIQHWIKIPELLMRPNDDFRPQAKLKPEMAEAYHLCRPNQTVIAFDDREDVCAAYRALGFFIVQMPGG